jgi:prepilin-type processing-associated H-X9-DG protein
MDTLPDLFGGPHWTLQISPYMTISTNRNERSGRYPFYCPASPFIRLTNYPRLSDQLSYAFNARLSTNSGAIPLVAVRVPTRTLMLVDNKYLRDQPDQSAFIGAGDTSVIANGTASGGKHERIPYERHGGHANILFVDGSVQPRKPVSASNLLPTNAIWSHQNTN